MNANDLINQVIEHANNINTDIAAFCAAEMKAGSNNTPETVQVTAYDILYKWLEMNCKEARREALNNIPNGHVWQTSDLTVYEKTEAATATLKLDDYRHQVKRTGRNGEDRKGYTPLAEKRAAELGYTTAKAAAL